MCQLGQRVNRLRWVDHYADIGGSAGLGGPAGLSGSADLDGWVSILRKVDQRAEMGGSVS